jgi:hypothetical protein
LKLIRSDYAQNKIHWAIAAVFQQSDLSIGDCDVDRLQLQKQLQDAVTAAIAEVPANNPTDAGR